MNQKRKKPPFIQSQRMRLLAETERPELYLRAEYFRAGRGIGAEMGKAHQGTWLEVDRMDVALNTLKNDDGSPCDLSRILLTTDAGVGKTTTMRWLYAMINTPGMDKVAFLLNFSQLPLRPEDLLQEVILPQFQRADGNQKRNLAPDIALNILETLRQEGRLVLLFDELDQTPSDGFAIRILRGLLEDPIWSSCRLVVSGRPYAMQRYWADLLDNSLGFGWRFVQLDEFDEAQQRLFLGRNEEGQDRFDLIPKEACDILATPRVLKYLRDLPDRELKQIETAGDVYWHSINHLLKEGMRNSQEARRLGLAAAEPIPSAVQFRSIRRACKLLGAIAFQMVATPIKHVNTTYTSDYTSDALLPNFEGVPPRQFERFKDQLMERLGDGSRQLLERDIDSLAALNDFVSHGLFNTDVVGLDRILWRNRTLQEFFAAYWLSQYCSASEAAMLRDWIYLPEVPVTEEYYWLWRFICEMHENARDPISWIQSVEPLYCPSDGTAQGTKRSSEMIYRAWKSLDQLAHAGETKACRVQESFLGEFEGEIISGNGGTAAKEIAEQFCRSLLKVDSGEFHMGSPSEKQGLPKEQRKGWEEHLAQEGDPKKLAEQHIARWKFPPGKRGQLERESEIRWWTRVFRQQDMDAVIQRTFRSDETPKEAIQQVDSFLLSRQPTTNACYRLFKVGHGEKTSCFYELYSEVSPKQDTPVVFVSWYDAWAFCLWAHWDGRSCRLPREYEWEYAAKAGTPWDQNYWWGNDFDLRKSTTDRRAGCTTSSTPAHANPWGFEDMLGNVWEWCLDKYQPTYDRDKPSKRSVRVLRGGSWCNNARMARSATRNVRAPTFAVYDVGFRVARNV